MNDYNNYPRTAPIDEKCLLLLVEDFDDGRKAAKIPSFSWDRRKSFFAFVTNLLPLLSFFRDSALCALSKI